MWPTVRAFLIAVALLLGGASGIPEPQPRELAAAPKVLQTAYGWVRSVQDAILLRVQFVPDLLQFSQHWKLFSGVRDAPFRIWIEARENEHDPWQLLYRPHDPEHAWEGEAIEFRRIRGNWNPQRSGPSTGYDPFVGWIAGRVFERFPRFRTVRVRMEEGEVLPRGRGLRSKGQFAHERLRHREEAESAP